MQAIGRQHSGRGSAPLFTTSVTAASRPRCAAWCSSMPRPSAVRKRCLNFLSAAGLASFTKLAADKVAADNVRINNVLPRFIDRLPEKEGGAQRVPMKRYGRMQETSELIAFLAFDKAGYITGQNIRIDDGITRSV